MSYDAGTAFLTVVPSFLGVRKAIQKEASAWGSEAGKTFAEEFEKASRRGLGDIPLGPGPAKSGKQGSESGGAFADGFRRRVEAALRSLPPVQIGAATSEAEQKLRDLRVDLAALAGKRIGIDIDAASAVAQVDHLNAELERLSASSPNIQVRADAARAASELAVVSAEARRLEALDPTINVDVDGAAAATELAAIGSAASGSSGGVSGLTALLVGLGPAAIPVLAAVAGAVAGIGAATVIGGGAGIGVLALGLVGVGKGVKGLADAEANATKTATGFANAQNQVASAADQVHSAEAGLANARAAAADGTVRAAQNVRDAERALAVAQAQARQAQVALTEARDEALRSLEDLNNQVIDGALAQRRSNLAQAQAKADLDRVLADHTATDSQREQAQLAFDEATQHGAELVLSNRRLAAEQEKATRAGVEGSKQVVAAQSQITAANSATAQAQQHLADAVREQTAQQRQSAFAIAQAQQGVISAQRAMAQATVASGTAGSAAMDKLQESMDGLGPSGQHFAVFLFSLKPALDGLRATAQDGILPGAEEGIRRILPLLPEVNGLVGDVSNTVGKLFDRTGAELNSPIWRRFFGFVEAEASPTLQNMANIAFDVGSGIAGILIVFKPVEDALLSGLTRIARGFAVWGESAGTNSEVQGFVRYILAKGPEVGRTIVAVAGAIGQVGVAAAPIGSIVLGGIRLLATVISSIPVPVLTALLAVIIPIVVAMRLWEMATGAVAKVQSFFTGVADAASGAVERFKGAVGDVEPKTSAAEGGVAGLAEGMGGPLVLALTAATALVGIFLEQAAEQKARVDGLKSSLLGLADSYGSSKDASSDMLKSLIANDENFRQMINDADGLGIGIDTVSEAVRGSKDALDKVNGSYDQQIRQLQNANEALKAGATGSKDYLGALLLQSQVQQEHGLVLGDRIRQLQAERDAVNAGSKATKEQADALKVIDGAQRTVTVSGEALSTADEQLYRRLRDVTNGTLDAASASRVLKDAHDRLYGAVQSQDQAAEKYAAGLDRLRESIKSGNTELGNNTAKARENKDTLRDLLKASVDQMNADIAAGVSVAEATRLHDLRVQALKDEFVNTGLNQKAVEGLVTTYGTVPDAITTQLKLLGYDTVAGQLDGLHDKVANLVKLYGLDVATAAKIANDPSHDALGRRLALAGHATGGYITGPGTGTSDSIIARLSNGEYVIPANVVANLGVGFFDQLIGRRKIRARMPGDGSEGLAFRNGGPVSRPSAALGASGDLGTWPALQVYLNLASQAGAIMAANPASYLPGVAAAQNFVLDQAGKPYVWASAGPDGYDCSGIVSAAYNLLHGRNPYNHTFSTMNEASYFPLAGSGPILTAGWSNAGERGGGDVGHTAGVVGGLAFESSGGKGVSVGARAIGLGAFSHVGHYDDGGYIQPGWSAVFNGTGRPEPVFTDSQWADISARGRGGDGPGMFVGQLVLDDGTYVGRIRGEMEQVVDSAFGQLADAHVYGVGAI